MLTALFLTVALAADTPVLPEDHALAAYDGLGVLEVSLAEKTFLPVDTSADRYEPYLLVYLDTEAANLEKPARAVKGVVIFTDLFWEVKHSVRWTINEPPAPGATERLGFSLKINRFDEMQTWLVNTDAEDIRALFIVRQILYEDGSVKEFPIPGE